MKAYLSFLIVSVVTSAAFAISMVIDFAARRGYGIEWFLFPAMFMVGWGVVYAALVDAEERRRLRRGGREK